MRVVIDLQACQASSKQRGIGRYSLALAQSMARCRGDHEILILLSDQFPETIPALERSFEGLLPANAIRVWASSDHARSSGTNRDTERESSQHSLDAFLSSLQPDFIHVASLFEGFHDDVVTDTRRSALGAPVAVTLYDLIPLLYPKTYLADARESAWYHSKLQALRCADLCLTISESTRQDAIQHLQIPRSRLVNISTDVDAHFRVHPPSAADERRLRQQLGLSRSFVMCTGGADPRKGMASLIRAFAALSPAVRRAHQLVIVCELNRSSIKGYLDYARELGLEPGDLVFTGYLSEADLVSLYNLCQLFVFPSKYEGFGLPVLEAMRCGAPVIASRRASMTEIVGWDEALFNPASDEDITRLMHRALTEPVFRQTLMDNGARQSTRFNWETSARTALAAMERRRDELSRPAAVRSLPRKTRPRMAFVSPLPPERSGISDYSAQLLPALSQHYQVDVIVNQAKVSDAWIERSHPILSVKDFVARSAEYERVVYQFGNSHFHEHMFALLNRHPGVVVLHDFFLSGIASQLSARPATPHFWAGALFDSHGYGALHEFFHGSSHQAIALKYPCSLSVIQASRGVIVHSNHATDLASRWYGSKAEDFSVIPLVRDIDLKIGKEAARQALGLPDGCLVVCSFGYLSPTKLNHQLMAAWARVMARGNTPKAMLLFVGSHHDPGYQRAIAQQMAELNLSKTVRITGWTSTENFHVCLAAADLCVQLRSQSRGETSAAVLDCLNYGQATIANAHGSMAELPDSAVLKLPDRFTDDELAQAIEQMLGQQHERMALGQRARAEIVSRHAPDVVAQQYAQAIEHHYQTPENALRHRKPRLYIDISAMIQGTLSTDRQSAAQARLLAWLRRPNFSHRVEPIYGSKHTGFRRAQRYTFGLMKIPMPAVDAPVEVMDGDAWITV